MAYIVMAYIVIARVVMAYIVMASVVMADIVLATIVVAYTIVVKVFVLNNTLAILRVELHASASALEFGPLSLGGLGCDMKPNTPDDGVCLRAKLGVIPILLRICI